MSSRSNKRIEIRVSLSREVYEDLLEEAREHRTTIDEWARCILGQWLISEPLHLPAQHRSKRPWAEPL